jgi:DNA-directed RNA polymerase subunit RPC12/RpoP
MADQEEDIVLNLNKQSIRGRACTVCGGKIIPSDRAVYQSAGNPSDVISLWQCERCGYEVVTEKPKVEKGKHSKE